jgi:DNA polymerase-1
VTIVHDKASALRALKELRRLKHRSHAWDTEAANVGGISRSDWRSPVTHGHVLCATCFCGDDADFGNGPRLLIDNAGPADGLLHRHFKKYFEDTQFKKVFHNYSFDRHLLARHDIRLRGFHADTLHLARLSNTSLASWEGKVQRREARSSNAFAAGRGQPPQYAEIVPEKSGTSHHTKVQRVTLGGRHLEAPSWSAGSGIVDVAVLEQSPDTCQDHHGPTGYGLKDLARYYGLTEEYPGSFAELFGTHSTAAEDAHNSPEGFSDWVTYATNDAVLTHRLFNHFHAELSARPWCSAVHQRSLSEILRDPGVVAELRKGRGSYGLTKQYETGRTMWDFFELYMRDFADCLADLEEIGIKVDCDALSRIEQEAHHSVKESHSEFVRGLDTARGPDGTSLVADADLINISSAQQLQTLLFGGAGKNSKTGDVLCAARTFPTPFRKEAAIAEEEEPNRPVQKKFELKGLGLIPSRKRKSFTATGQPSTSAEVLTEFAGKGSSERAQAYKQFVDRGICREQALLITHSLQQLKEAKTKKAFLAGFAQPLQEYARPTGRIHPQWKFDTSTGRLACRKPNLQNLPARQRDTFSLRSAFEASPGNSLVVADYSQLELRVLAHVTNCSSMIDKLSKGGDYHSEVTMEMFRHVDEAVRHGDVVVDNRALDTSCSDARGLPTIKEKFGIERNQAKAVNFGIVFGMEAASLAEDLGIEPHQAEDLIEAWYRSKPEVKRWRQQTIRESSKSHQALSLLGRWRTLPLIDAAIPKWRRRSERAAVNFAIQGSSADVVLAAMLRIWKSPELRDLGFRMVLQVHDEFVLEGPEAFAVEASELVQNYMLEPFKDHQPDFQFKVPLTSDVAVGRSFLSAKP